MSAPAEQTDVLFNYVVSLADTVLILGQRMVEWTGHGPMLEEDIALSNLGLDMLGQARALYTYAGEVEGKGRNEDALAFLRDSTDFKNLLLVEQPNGDFAMTMVRHFFYASFAWSYWRALKQSTDVTLSAIAAKAEKELAYHRRHSAEWVIRLGDGTKESHQRAQLAVDTLWPYTAEMFELLDQERMLLTAGIIVDVSALQSVWSSEIHEILSEATLAIPQSDFKLLGGRQGEHTEHLGYMLAEMQHMQRTYPGLNW